MKTLYVLLVSIFLSFSVFSQNTNKSSKTPAWGQDKGLVISFIPSISISPSYLLATIGFSTEAQICNRFAFAPTGHVDLLGRYYVFGFHCAAFVFTTKTTKLGFGYQRMEMDIIHNRVFTLPEDGEVLHSFVVDSRFRLKDNWGLRATGGINWNNLQFSFGLVYRFIQEGKEINRTFVNTTH